MDIVTSNNSITITGNIKTVMDYQTIKENIDTVVETHQKISIHIVDSISMTSSIIGYFNKLILKDKIQVDMKVSNEQLLELLEDLNLTALFHVTKG